MLAGCSKNKETTSFLFPEAYSGCFDADYNGLSLSGTFSWNQTKTQLQMQYPEELNGMTVLLEKGQVIVEYDGMSDTTTLPDSAFPSVFHQLVQSAAALSANAIATEKGYQVTGTFRGSNFLLELDNLLNPVAIEAPALGFSVTLVA